MKFKLVPILLLLAVTIACTPIEQNARDTSAALKGAIESAQAQYLDTCKATPAQTVCVDINKAVAGQNALITSIEAYCGWSQTAPPADLNAACVPVKTAETALQSAISNANLLVAELKAIISAPKGVTP